MDQELKQRLIGAAVITALATIFVPMLFDDPIDETGKNINELKIPELPTKVQDVEILPLPSKVEDVATEAPIEKPAFSQASQPTGAAINTSPMQFQAGEEDFETPKPKLRLSAKETVPLPQQRSEQMVVPDMDVAEAEDVAPRPEIGKVSKLAMPPAVPTSPVTASTSKPAVAPAQKNTEPKLVESKTAITPAESPQKTSASVTNVMAPTRWYLNAGSFSQRNNAATLQDNLQQQGFAASIKEVATDKGVVFKVRIGPMLDKAKVQAVKSKLAQININTFMSGDE